jgi:hypothetical protein
MQRSIFKRTLAATFCLLVLGTLLFLAGCGNGYNSPGSPQATPTKGGYSIIYLLDHEMQILQASPGR